jgi:hypothetical protein
MCILLYSLLFSTASSIVSSFVCDLHGITSMDACAGYVSSVALLNGGNHVAIYLFSSP